MSFDVVKCCNCGSIILESNNGKCEFCGYLLTKTKDEKEGE